MRNLCFALLALSVLFPSIATARPKYQKEFTGLYGEHYIGNAKAAQCTVCHRGEKKTQRWKYGEALSEALGAKNLADTTAIQRALRDVEPKPSAIPGMTYGDLIRAGRLPTEGE
jgi:hypothetical protein